MRSNTIQARRVALIVAGIVLAITLTTGLTTAETPATGPILSFTATTDNVSGAHDSIRIDLLRWSTDAERDQLLAAWTLTAPAAGRGGRARGAADPEDDPTIFGNEPEPPAGGTPGRGAGARGAGRPVRTPESSLTAALVKALPVGQLWSSEVAGYSINYAVRVAEQDGGERIVLITDRRLGAWNDLWKPAGPGVAANYDFSVIELHLNSKGEGEGKVSLTGKVALDSAAKTLTLENYSALPVVLKNVRRRTS